MSFWKRNISKNGFEDKEIVQISLRNDSTIVTKCDKYLNIFLGETSVKIIRIVSELTKAFENLISKFEVLETKNSEFRDEIDRLKAMLNVRSGKFTEYQKRVNEFNVLGIQLTKEASELKSTFDANESNKGDNFSQNYKKISNLNKLMQKIQSKLNNDYKALITAGNPEFSDYLKQITGLNVFCRSLHEELHRLETAFRLRGELKNKDQTIIFQEVHHLQELINEVKIEIEKLRSTPLRIGCRIGGEDSNQYLKEVLILIEIVEKSKVTVTDLKNSIGTDEISCKRKISELEVLSKRLQFEIKKLEMVVASGDNSSLIKRIEELENSIFRLKKELTENEEFKNSLQQELAGAKIVFRQKIRDLKVTKSKVRSLTDEVQLAKQESMEKDQKIEKLLYRLETQNFSIIDEQFLSWINSLKSRLEDIRSEKDMALKEMDQIRNFLLEGMKEISQVLREKRAIEEDLKAELEELREENSGLKSSMQLLKKKETSESDKQVKECGNSGPEDLIENVEKENRNLKVLLKKATDDAETIKSLMEVLKNEKEDTISSLKLELNEIMTIRDQLKLDLEVEKTRKKETLKAFDKLSIERDELEGKMKILKDENDNLSSSYRDVVEECSVCRNQLESLRREAYHQAKYYSSLKTKMSLLTEELVSTRKELEAANLRNTSLEEDLKLIAFREEDLGKENDDLRAELNKTQIERQGLVEELSQWKEESRLNETHLKTRTNEFNELKVQNTRLQHERETENVQAERKIEILKKQNSSLQEKSEQLESQLCELREEINELGKSDLNFKKEKEKLESYLDKLKQELDLLKAANEKYQIEFEKQRNQASFEPEKLKEKMTLKNMIQIQNEGEADSHTENETGIAEKNIKRVELEILKMELSKSRNENKSLKNQLEELRNNILSVKEEQNKLKSDNEEIKGTSEIQQEINFILKKQLENFLKENDKLEITKMKLNDFDPKLRGFCKDYVVLKKSLQTALEEIHNLKEKNANLIKKLHSCAKSGIH